MYSYMFEINPGEVVPNDATVLCGTPDGLLCEVIYEVIKPPRRMRDIENNKIKNPLLFGRAIVKSAYGRTYTWDRKTYNEVFYNSIPVESEVYTV